MCGRCTARLAAMPWLSKCFLFHQSSRENHRFLNCIHELIARWQRKCMSPPGDQNMHRLQLFSTPWKLRRVAKTCREKKENGKRTSGTYRLRHTKIVWKLMLYLFNYPYIYNTISFRWNRMAVGDSHEPGFVVTITVLIAMWILIAFPGRPEIR